jgi:hypothetical protein
MDQGSFDRIVTTLATASTRRAGVIAALGTALALARGADGKPRSQGPCGNGSRKANRCRKNKDCCTGICDTTLVNQDGDGRCRCRRRGKACTEDRNCCSRGDQSLVCVGGVCGDACTQLGQECLTGDSACCAGSCPTVAGSERGFQAVCCLGIGESGCMKDTHCCQNAGPTSCIGGVCAQACTMLGELCDVGATSCCAGSCVVSGAGWERGLSAICCLPDGTSGCSDDTHCCQNAGQLFCNAGTCGGPD